MTLFLEKSKYFFAGLKYGAESFYNACMKTRFRTNSVRSRIRRMIVIAGAGMALIVLMFSVILIYTGRKYEEALLCANTAADFNSEFKSTLDMDMYNHVIRPRSEVSEDDLPLAELDQAEEVLQRLEEATSLPDNQWRAQSMLDMCRNLRTYMIEIEQTGSYDERMELLERNIRGETGLTVLIEDYMHDFIDAEIRELARMMGRIHSQRLVLIAASFIAVVLLSLFVVFYAVRISRGITRPVHDLSRKAERFGTTSDPGEPVNTDITELRVLDQTFDQMAAQINALMEKQMEDQKSLHRAELELLLAQINPHFLYNTLDSIAILAESEREEDVVNMVTSLSTFFRNSLNDGRDIITLRAELAQATSYLEIQQIRYSDILDYSIDVPEDMLDCMVPKLILQPLIENALYHGIKNRRGRGMIRIAGERQGEDMILRVRDDGAGMEPEKLEELRSGLYQEHHRGVGLKNVSQRIRLYCGEDYGIRIESEPGKGTEVTVNLPAKGVTGI